MRLPGRRGCVTQGPDVEEPVSQLSDDLIGHINQLDASTVSRRQAAERALLDCAEQARPLLRRSVDLVERPLLAAQAALLLVRMRDRGARAALLSAVDRHPNDNLRAILLRAAADLADPSWADPTQLARLEALSEDADADLREAASRALARVRPEPDPTLDVDAGDLAAFAQLAAGSADADLREAIRELGRGDTRQRRAAEQHLLQAGRRAQRVLIEALAEPSARVRTGAVRMLLQLPTPDASGALLMVATGGGDSTLETDLRAMALRALGVCLVGVENHVVDDLAELTVDADRFIRAGAASALGRLPVPEAAAALLPLLDDADAFVIEEAARGLGRKGVTPEGLDRVRAELDDGLPRAQAPLLRALAGELAAPLRQAGEARDRLLRVARAQLRSGEPERVTAALSLLDQLHGSANSLAESDQERVAGLLSHADLAVLQTALGVLASHASPGQAGVVAALERLGAQSDPSVQILVEAVRARLNEG